jgi:adenylate cyclase
MRIARPTPAAILPLSFAVAGVLWGGFLGVRQIAGVSSALDSIEHLTVDWRFKIIGAQPAPRSVVIAAIDDETIREAGGYPLPRAVLARIVRELAAFNPQAIGIDIAFLDAGQPEADSEFAEALRSTRSVVAAIGLFDSDSGPAVRRQALDLSLAPSPSRILWPTATIDHAAKSGLVNIATDAAGIPRHIPMVYRVGNAVFPSFALATASVALNTEPVLGSDILKLAARTTRTDLGYHMPIRYYGPRGGIRQFSAARILQGTLDPDDVRGQVVLVGVTAVGVGDTFATPFDRVVPGVEISATGITNLLAGDGLIRTPPIRMIDAGAAVLLPLITILLMAMSSVTAGLGFAALLFMLWGGATVLAFREGYWLSIAVPMAAVVPIAFGYGAARIGLDRRIANRLTMERARLTKFQSPLLLNHILSKTGFLEQPATQNVAVVFLDLSDFTGVAEGLGPKWARDLLLAFQGLIDREVLALDGFVVSFMGDGAMIVFGLPEPRPDDGSRALQAINRLQASINAWLQDLPPIAKERLSVRIGGHYGPAVVSRLGAAHHQHITATGDTVNVTSRLLEVAKQQQCSIVVSEDLYVAANLAGASPGAVADLEVKLRGRAQLLRVKTWK